MSSITRLIDPNPPLTAAQVQAAAAAAIAAADAPSPIQSIQRGTTAARTHTTSTTVTITAVNTSKSCLRLLGARGMPIGSLTATGSSRYAGCTIELENSTTIRVKREGLTDSGPQVAIGTISYEVIEYV